ncbi:MAG: zinc-binding alcohol dehydrogenase family protein [Aeromicrobium sp.]|uniref:zinc-binding alcohol dehydrogenase family protein n=1 Tax=Aeromicrobium sp. TaxID=1871063 RepID=UPI0026067AEB|nr:zinc-binding alcohol dehydrogenase family protein [Aeromicrobium sp.]MDF1705486.1 zinc-binding alcohol dehydrogenase family protein [Aeromicrobium sp.]
MIPNTAVAFTRSLPATDPEALVDVVLDAPSPGPHDLVVDVRAVSVNPVDVKVRLGGDPDGERVLGFDASGIVRDVGRAVTLFQPGDEVWYAGDISRPGSNAALHLVDERIVGPKPTTLSFTEAAALPLTAITAWESLFDKLRLTPDSSGTLLVVGATGGVGSIMLQIVEHLLPQVAVIATASRPEGEAWVRSLGADHVVNHRDDLAAGVGSIAPDGVDWIFTAHSEGMVETFADLLRPFGAVVAIDDPSSLDVRAFKSKSLSWHWELMFTRPLQGGADQVRQHEILTEVARLVDAGTFRSTITTTLTPIDAAQLREAHRLVEDGHVIGKVVVARED